MASHSTEGSFALKLPVEIWRVVIISAVQSLEPMDNCHEASESLTTQFHLARRVTSKSPEYALMLVCKVLNTIAIEFFYERISVRSKGQLIALTEGLKSPRIANYMANWTRRFDFNHWRTPEYNNRDKGLLVRVLRSCPNLTHLVIDLAMHESKVGAKARDASAVIDACAKSCKRLEVLHLAFNFTTYMSAQMPLGVFLTTFRNIKTLRLGKNAKIAFPEEARVHPGELPFLHTFEACEDASLSPFTDVRLPSLSTVHFRGKHFPSYGEVPYALLGFISTHGNKLTTLTFIGVVQDYPAFAREVVPLLVGCTRLQAFVTDIIDLVPLLRFDQLVLSQLTRLELSNDSSAWPPSPSGFRATLIADLRAHFPSLEVLRWLGRVDKDVTSHNTREGLDPSEGGTDAHHANAAGIQIENRDGDKLELCQLLVQ
ncbi:hypothetical protein BD410DRAFT_381668 [Rickenella mellea]|uniref:F-box domain-containing protein n=1 Tax=Rickenella mellea TaxID=50990 RepID=A0A4Y7PYL2_9AGAM|nr:hypothetical protein BD410DRAFT_381668 [Rickenella mellea]